MLCYIKDPSGTKVPRLGMCRSIISLTNKAHQILHIHLFSQRNKTSGKAVGVGVGCYRETGGVEQKLKIGEGRSLENQSIKTPLPTMNGFKSANRKF